MEVLPPIPTYHALSLPDDLFNGDVPEALLEYLQNMVAESNEAQRVALSEAQSIRGTCEEMQLSMAALVKKREELKRELANADDALVEIKGQTKKLVAAESAGAAAAKQEAQRLGRQTERIEMETKRADIELQRLLKMK
eukprot:PhM_4_TR17091/c0_g1_i1/m.49381